MVTLSPPDRGLVAEAQAGSHEALEALFRQHWLEAWRAAYGITANREWADDVVQEAFERAFQRLTSFSGRGSFAAWLHRIVVNRALDLMRRERPSLPLDAISDLAAERQPGIDHD